MFAKIKKTTYIFVLFLTISVSSVREARAQSGWETVLISAITVNLIVMFIPRIHFIYFPTHQIQDTRLSRADIAEVLQRKGFKQIQSTCPNESEFIDTLGQVAIYVKHKRKGKHRFRVVGMYSYRRYAAVYTAASFNENAFFNRLGGIPRKEAKALLRTIAAELAARTQTARVAAPKTEMP